jgi:hypothetical protein
MLELQQEKIIEEILHEFSMRMPDEAKIQVMSDKVKRRAVEIQNELKRQGIDIRRAIKPAGTKIKNELASGFKRNEKPENVGKKIIRIIYDTLKQIAETTLGKWVLGLWLFLALMFILVVPLPTPIHNFINTFLCGPILEEAFKAVAVRMNIGYQFTTIFAGFEMYKYLESMVKNGIRDVGSAFRIRVMTFFLHMLTTWLQKFMYEKFKDKEGRLKYLSWGGFVLAVIIHALWNANAFNVVGKLTTAAASIV